MSEFKVVSEYSVPNSKLNGKLYEHQKTGMQVVILKNSDENRTFSINLVTPPKDSKGTPHILEHSVLCGSKNFPLKDPFSALLRSSLHTFLNAFTAHSYTSYPAASLNEKDFYNLFTVYWDAVFNPLLTPETFARQAWHYRLNGSLSRQGVVYNEMKGRYADADSTLYRSILKAIFPGTHYEKDSGGDPVEIPTLTYDELKKFHSECYHPSNARVMVYGNVKEEEVFSFLSDKLSDVRKQNRLSESPITHNPFSSSEVIEPYQPAGGREIEKEWIATTNWRIPYNGSLSKEISWTILEDILYGSQGSPLYLALMNSGLGDRVAGFGLVDTNHDAFFSCGLKNIRGEDRTKVHDVIMNALKKISTSGITQGAIDAVVNSFEFRLREQVFNAANKGIQLLSYVTSSWLFHDNPFRTLSLLDELTKLKSSFTPDYFQNLVKAELLESQSVQVALSPDKELFSRAESLEAKELSEIKPKLSESEKSKIIEVAKLVDDATPDGEELLSKIPILSISDLESKIKKFPSRIDKESFGVILSQAEETTGIVYLQIAFNLRKLNQADRLWVPLLSRCLTGTGTSTRSLIQLTEEMQRDTGGIGASRHVGLNRTTKDQVALLSIDGSSLNSKADRLIDLISDVTLNPALKNKERVIQIIGEMKASLEQGISTRPSSYVQRRATRCYSFVSSLEDDLSGFGQLEFLRLVAQMPWEEVLSSLEAVRSRLFVQDDLLINVTAESAFMTEALKAAKTLGQLYPKGEASKLSVIETPSGPTMLGVVAPVRVGYTSIGIKTKELDRAAAEVVMSYLSDSYLWNEIRVAGGAYGAACGFDREDNFAHFFSWDDPNPKRSFDVYKKAGAYLLSETFSQDEIKRSIIGTIGSIDQPLSPAGRGARARMLYMFGVTDEERQMRRDDILSCSDKDFKTIGELLAASTHSSGVYVLSEEGVIETQKEIGGEILRPLKS